ncbi:hypothetical protein QW131_27970 [Roseibium salinum]|nr:hypothetical protein [Roseibium salinum]
MIKEFGVLPDGTAVQEVTLKKKGSLEASVLTLGAIIRDLRVDGESVVLGFEDLQSYLNHSSYFGVVAGRCANRTAGGKMTIDGVEYQLDRNERGRNHLHGGSQGFFHARLGNRAERQGQRALETDLRRRRHGLSGTGGGAGALFADGQRRVAG